jgi:uncharacterized protein (TIGR00369 family)
MKRTKTIKWQDPMESIDLLQKMSGLDYLQAINTGKIPYPPLANTLDFKAPHVETGKAIFSFQPQEFHYNPLGTVHGGVISAILDSAMGCALHTLLPAGTGYITVELKVNFLKAITIQSGELRAIGNIIHVGSRTALTEGKLIDDNDTIYAFATSTCLIMKK